MSLSGRSHPDFLSTDQMSPAKIPNGSFPFVQKECTNEQIHTRLRFRLDITPGILQSHGIRAALIDLDGTMVSHKTALPTEEVAAFIRRLEDNGIHVVVFSNNNANRVGTFCEPLGVDFISRAHKPFARAYAQAVEKLGLPIDQIAVIGDQIYTDVFGGNRAGALTCYVETLDRRFFWINVRYQLERGFIARGRRRMEARRHD